VVEEDIYFFSIELFLLSCVDSETELKDLLIQELIIDLYLRKEIIYLHMI
jgi:hypothetical protein